MGSWGEGSGVPDHTLEVGTQPSPQGGAADGGAQDPSLRLPGMAGVSSSATVRDPEAHTSL